MDTIKGLALIGTFIGVLITFAMWVSLWENVCRVSFLHGRKSWASLETWRHLLPNVCERQIVLRYGRTNSADIFAIKIQSIKRSKRAKRLSATAPLLWLMRQFSPAFKLVFLTAAIGTLLFVLICVTTTLLAGKEPPPLTEKITMALFDLAKIGFGSVVGLLGGQALKG